MAREREEKVLEHLAEFADQVVVMVEKMRDVVERFAADWQAVVTAAEKVKGADVEAAKKAWTDLDTAVSAVPDSATLIEAAAQIMTPVQSLMTVAGDLAELAGDAEE